MPSKRDKTRMGHFLLVAMGQGIGGISYKSLNFKSSSYKLRKLSFEKIYLFRLKILFHISEKILVISCVDLINLIRQGFSKHRILIHMLFISYLSRKIVKVGKSRSQNTYVYELQCGDIVQLTCH